MIESIRVFPGELKVGARSLARAKGLTVDSSADPGPRNRSQRRDVQPGARRAVCARWSIATRTGSSTSARARQASETTTPTFSVPEIEDLRSRVKTLSSFGDFSTIGFTMVGLGEPRSVQAGVVGGSYFQVMGLRPVLGPAAGCAR